MRDWRPQPGPGPAPLLVYPGSGRGFSEVVSVTGGLPLVLLAVRSGPCKPQGACGQT